MTVDILLAVFNGAKYLETQILSIISQSHNDWRLIIHDDGSTDDTINIINKWSRLDSRIQLIDDAYKCGGAAQNFLYLLQFSTSNYIMFADQDDIWFDNKIEFMLNKISVKDDSIPQVLYTNSYVWKEEIGIIGTATHTFPKNLKDFLFLNSGIQGCAAIFNKKMASNMQSWKGPIAMHDHLLHIIGLSFGEVSYLNVPLMLYRNHDNNVTGGTSTKIYDFSRLFKNQQIPVIDRKHFNAVKSFRGGYEALIKPENFKTLDSYLLSPELSFMSRTFLLLKAGFRLFDSRFNLMVKHILRPYIN